DTPVRRRSRRRRGHRGPCLPLLARLPRAPRSAHTGAHSAARGALHRYRHEPWVPAEARPDVPHDAPALGYGVIRQVRRRESRHADRAGARRLHRGRLQRPCGARGRAGCARRHLPGAARGEARPAAAGGFRRHRQTLRAYRVAAARRLPGCRRNPAHQHHGELHGSLARTGPGAMTRTELGPLSRWLPATLVAAVVLLAGGRLIALSMRDHAAQMRAAAQRAVARGSAGFFGPVRYGSQWMIAAYAALEGRPATAAVAAPAWAVGYESLDSLLVRAGFGRLASDGYDFEITQIDPLTHRVRELFGSRPDVPADAVSGAIRAPAALSPPGASAYLVLALWPRSGWYPVRDLTTRTGLLLLLGWAFVFGTHELTASVRRTQGALAQVRKRLHAVNERLFNEMEQHQALQKSLEHARYHDPFT